jgi:hypothetical protein
MTASVLACGVNGIWISGSAYRRGVDSVHRREVARHELALDADDPVADFDRRHGLGCGRARPNRLDAASWCGRWRGRRPGLDRQAEVSLQFDHRRHAWLKVALQTRASDTAHRGTTASFFRGVVAIDDDHLLLNQLFRGWLCLCLSAQVCLAAPATWLTSIIRSRAPSAWLRLCV